LSFTYKNFDGKIPEPGPLSEADQSLLDSAREALETVNQNLYDCHFKAAVNAAFSLAQQTNRYLDSAAPWKSIKTDRPAAATSLWVSIAAINCLKVALYPFLPFSSQKLHEFLGFDGEVEQEQWDFDHLIEEVSAGKDLRAPSPLYTKLDPLIVEEEIQRLGVGAA